MNEEKSRNLIEELNKYRGRLQNDMSKMASESDVAYHKRQIDLLSSELLRNFIAGSNTIINEYGDTLYDKISEADITHDTIAYVNLILSAFVYEAVIVNSALIDDFLIKFLADMQDPIDINTDMDRARKVFFTRISTLILRDQSNRYLQELATQKKDLQNFANTAAAKAKENVDAINNADSNLKDYLEKAKDLRGELGFLVLTRAFTSFIRTKELDIKRSLKYLKGLGILLLVIPVTVFSWYMISEISVKNDKLANNVSEANTTTIHTTSKMIVTDHKTPPPVELEAKATDKHSAKQSSVTTVDWTSIINRFINFLPIAVAELILLFYFRIILANYNAANAQLLQLKMRKSVCQFIQDYIEFKQKNKIEDLDKFDSLIFSNLMPSAEQIPATFEGLEQLGKILGEFKPKKD